MRVQATNPNFFGKVNYDHKLVYSIHHDLFDVPYDENRTFAPSWYNSPGTCFCSKFVSCDWEPFVYLTGFLRSGNPN
jgi:hypothetical protein